MAVIIRNGSCGTCEFWSGERALGQGGRAVQCAQPGVKGTCLYKTMSKSTPHPANQPKCPKYAQWRALK